MQTSIEITDFLSFWIREREKWKGKTQLTRFMVLLFHLTLSVYYHDLAESSTFTALRGIYSPASFKTEPQKVSAIGEWGLGLWIDLGRDQSCSYSHMEHEGRVVCALVSLCYCHGHNRYWSSGHKPQKHKCSHSGVKRILFFLNPSIKPTIPCHSPS